MASYCLRHKNKLVASFQINRSDVLEASIEKNSADHLPLPLKRILHFKEEFIATETESKYILNEEGCLLIDCWLSDREIPVNRENYSAYVHKGSTARQFMLENYGYSLTDCYWMHDKDEVITWEDIKKKRDSVDNYLSVKDSNRMYKGQNATLGGQLEKFWYKSGGQLKMCKKTGALYDVLNAREIFASEIYKDLGYENHCDYDFVYDTAGDVIGCKCFSFIRYNEELITAYDLLEEYNLTQADDVYEKVIECAVRYGASEEESTKYMDIQSLVDYLVTNRDRHQGNIGFIRNADTLSIISPAPVYDSGSCKHLEGEKPEGVEQTTVNGLYPTEGEVLEHVKDLSIVNIEDLPGKEKYRSILNECRNISEYRKRTLLDLYEQKKEYLFQKQKNFLTYQDKEEIDL